MKSRRASTSIRARPTSMTSGFSIPRTWSRRSREGAMADGPDNIVLQYLRRFDAKLDRVVDEMLDVKVRLTAVEEGLAGVNRRLDRVEIRIERVEARVDLVRPPRCVL